MTDAQLFKEPCWLENEVELFPLNCTRNKRTTKPWFPDHLSYSHKRPLSNEINCTQIFPSLTAITRSLVADRALFHSDSAVASLLVPPFTSTQLSATGLFLSKLKPVDGPYMHTALFPEPRPQNASSVERLCRKCGITSLDQKELRNPSLAK